MSSVNYTNTQSSPIINETLASSTVQTDSTGGFSNKTIIIILIGLILIILLNDGIGNIFRNIAIRLYNLFMNLLALFGLVTGSAIHATADAVGDVGRTGVDITEGTLHSVGKILKGSQGQGQIQGQGQGQIQDQGQGQGQGQGQSQIQGQGQGQIQDQGQGQGINASLDQRLNTSNIGQQNAQLPVPDTTENPLQNPISQNKLSWCLVGDYKGRRGCIEVSERDKCMSGQVYPSQKMCLNPTLSQNA